MAHVKYPSSFATLCSAAGDDAMAAAFESIDEQEVLHALGHAGPLSKRRTRCPPTPCSWRSPATMHAHTEVKSIDTKVGMPMLDSGESLAYRDLVLVKTPACPTVVCPPPADAAAGAWSLQSGDEGWRRAFGAKMALLGFALMGSATALRRKLAAQVSGLLPWSARREDRRHAAVPSHRSQSRRPWRGPDHLISRADPRRQPSAGCVRPRRGARF